VVTFFDEITLVHIMTTLRINISELNEHTLAILQLLKDDKYFEVIQEDADRMKESLIAQAIEAEKAYKNGAFMSQADLKLKSSKW
jgi:hypothetical protein